MRLQSVEIANFRSFESVAMDVDSRLTVLVGENATGKSTIALALTRLFDSISSGLADGRLQPSDLPYAEHGDPSIAATFELSAEELETHLVNPLVGEGFSENDRRELSRWLRNHGTDIRILLNADTGHRTAHLEWGDLVIAANRISIGKPRLEGAGTSWDVMRPAEQNGREVTSIGV